jgi:galactose oxidase
VAQVNLLRLGAVTHAYDENQRIVRLNFLASAGKVTVDGPASNYDAPPGYYMLFLISADGVPSVSEYVRVKSAEWP